MDHLRVVYNHGDLFSVPRFLPRPSGLPEVPHWVGRAVTPGFVVAVPRTVREETTAHRNIHYQLELEKKDVWEIS